MPRHRIPRGLRVLAPALLLAVSLGPAVRAQDARPGVFGESLDVRVVNVEVVVTDKKGARVDGLAAADFQLEVDGKVVPIDYFTEIVGGRVAELPEGAPPQAAPPAADPGQPLGVSWLVFIDDYFSLERDRDKVLDSLQEQIGHLGPQDRMAIVAWDGKKLTMISSWTSSQPALERAWKAAKKRDGYGLRRYSERERFDNEQKLRLAQGISFGAGAIADPAHLDPEERYYVDNLAAQVQHSVSAAAATLRAFAQPPGRKAMLLLSGGWPWRPVDYAIPEPQRMITERTLGDLDLFRPLADVANLLGYTLYTVDVPGMIQRLVDASQAFPLDPERETLREQDLHMSLDWLARETGGRSFLNSQRLSVFEDAVTDTRSFYWLGFTPKRSGDDKPHEVKVTVKRPGLDARARQGYLDASRKLEVSMAVESALLFGNPASSLPLGLTVGKPEKQRGRTMRVPIEVTVPLDALTALPGEKGPEVSVELRIAAQDSEGNLAEIPVIPLHVQIPEKVKVTDGARYTTAVVLRRSPHDLVVALYEPASGKIFSATARISP